MAQSVRHRRRQDDVVVHKQVAGWRIAVGGHALADDLVDVAGLGDARPGEVDDVPVEVGYRGVQAEESLKETQREVSQNDGQGCREKKTHILDPNCLPPDQRLPLPAPSAVALRPPAPRAHDDVPSLPLGTLISVTVKDDLEPFRCACRKVEGQLDLGGEDLLGLTVRAGSVKGERIRVSLRRQGSRRGDTHRLI